ncbi:MAG: TIGR03560 family F420-dependent LLM class oxidoreductase [Chloroflexi bacterium]|nr:MAG: TIGR03560 family F420-dependent LLM class oxidoreductase [Chloroflexota bacterium]
MKFGIHLGQLGGPLAEMRRLWRFADDNGFDWFSVSDHFQESPPQGGDGDCFEALTSLTALALETSRVRVGCLVFCVGYRHPGVLAKAMSTIDHLSRGRADCGLGAGWHESEFAAYGLPFPSIREREDQLEEYAQVLRLLFDERRADFSGTYYTLHDAPNNPKPLQAHLPIWIGGSGEKRTLRAAARHADGWNAPYLAPDEWRRKSAVLDDWCEKAGRDPASIARTINVGFYMGADPVGAKRHEELYQRHWGNDRRGMTGFLRGTATEAADVVAKFAAAGAQRLNIALREGPYDFDALAAFRERVMPQFA